MPFKYPIYFIVRGVDRVADHVYATPVPPCSEVPPRLWDEQDFCWTVQAYLELKQRGYDVHIQRQMQPDAICVAHYDSIILKDWPVKSFIVGIRPDRPAIPLAHMTIVQNQTQLGGKKCHFVPLFGQPNLIPRDPQRGDRVERIVYLGRDYNLKEAFRSEDFHRRLAELGITLEIRHQEHYDYTTADVTLAARPGTRYDIDLKPATKLYNSWMAGVPALAGPESAHRHIRKSELDYIEVNNAEDAIRGLKRLKDEPGLYRRMVENGLLRAKEFSRDVIAQQWIDLLAGPVTEEYERWLRRGKIVPGIVRDARFAALASLHKGARYVHAWRI